MPEDRSQQFVQRLLEGEVDDLLGRKKSERRGEEGLRGYPNGYARPRPCLQQVRSSAAGITTCVTCSMSSL